MVNAAAPVPKANMGEPAVRLDARLKVTGDARYPSDVPVGNPAYAYLVTSTIARGRIERLALGAAFAVPGVLDILTEDNTSELKNVAFSPRGGGASTSIQRLGPEIEHAGQIIAVVIADTFEAAREAALKVEVTYAPDKPSATFGSPGLSEEDASRVAGIGELPSVGDVEAAFDDAEVAIDVEYHNPIELFTTTCTWTDDRLALHEPSQFVYGLKNSAAQRLAAEPDKVEVVSPFVGGAFGSKTSMTPRTGLIALAAKRLNRAVKLVATRSQGFTISTYRAETRHHVRLGARRNGKLVGYAHEGWELSSRPDPYVVAGVEDTARLYAFGAVDTEVHIVHADRSTPGFMRSPPMVPYMYALETAMDELAVKLGMDPIELRRVNDAMAEPIEGKPFSSRSLMKCYHQAADSFGWMRRNPQPGSMREGEWLIGWGCATALYPTHIAPAAVRVRFSPAGDVRVQMAAQDLGTGA
jgi:xanthine dehydrogenase YagR molybdenum-binding subunit